MASGHSAADTSAADEAIAKIRTLTSVMDNMAGDQLERDQLADQLIEAWDFLDKWMTSNAVLPARWAPWGRAQRNAEKSGG